jgi:hypothetical protein
MPRPFPDVDPFLESQGLWPDFHVSFLAELRNALADRLPEPYVARIDERMNLVELPSEEARPLRPHVAISRRLDDRGSGSPLVVSEPMTATLEPEIIPFVSFEEFRGVSIEILHGQDRRRVTVVGLLSPTNKTGTGRQEYLAKRQRLLRLGDVHLVELDFLVGGHRLPMVRPPRQGDYHAYVARSECQPDCEVYTWTVRQPPPSIPIPLRAPDPDVRIEIAPLLGSVFHRARYERSIRYDLPLEIHLAPENREWAEKLAKSHLEV